MSGGVGSTKLVDVQNPLVWLVVALLLIVFLVVDHWPYEFDFLGSIVDDRMHHEDLILWLSLFALYCLWKLLH